MTKNVTTYMISSSTAARKEAESCPRGFICAITDPLQDIADLNQTYSCAQLQQDARDNGYGDVLDGIYCPEGSNSIKYCPIGNYCEDPASDPIICPAGFYCPVMTRTPLFQCRHCGEGSQEFAIIILPFILLWIFFILLYVASKWRRVLNTCRTRGGADKSFEDYSDQMIDDCEENNSSGAQIDSHSNNLDNETGRENETIDNWQEDPSGAQMDSHSSNSDNESGRENAWNGIEISVRNLSLAATAKRQEKILVNDFTGTLKKGSMTAVMGSTGVGKTSLLNALSGRAHYGKVTGNLKINGNEVHISDFANTIGFVPQDDIFDSELTVKENFVYAGRFKSHRSTPKHEIDALALQVITSLGLEKVTNSIIRNGVSGGERKRVNVGVELMGKPGILFIDEPTTSLDSTVALSLMKVLKNLPKAHGVTVCCSIHQPGPRIFELFHSLILLSIGGRLAYNGPTEGVVNYFSNRLNYDIPRPDLGVAEWVLDISVGMKDDSTENNRRNQIRICQAWADRDNNSPDNTAQTESVHHPTKGILSQIWLQLHRNSIFFIRNFDTFILDTFQILLGITLFALIVGPKILFSDDDLNMPYEYEIMTSITNDGGSIFGQNLNYLFLNSLNGIEREVTETAICGALPGIVIALSTTRYLTDKRRQFFREAASGYSVTAYYIAINIWSTFEVTAKMLLIGTSYYTLRNSAASCGATLIPFVLMGWISSGWGLFFPIFSPPNHANIVTGVFVTFGCLLLSGSTAPFNYPGIYDSEFKGFLADSFGPLRFFIEAIVVSEYMSTPAQYGFTGQYPHGSNLFDISGLAQLGDAKTRTSQSTRGWHWGIWPSICHGLAIRVLSLILVSTNSCALV